MSAGPGAPPAPATAPGDAPRSTPGAAPATDGDRSGRLVILGCFLVAIYAWGLLGF